LEELDAFVKSGAFSMILETPREIIFMPRTHTAASLQDEQLLVDRKM